MGLVNFTKKYICSTNIGASVVNFFLVRNIDEKFYSLFVRRRNRYDAAYPSEAMKESEKFFKKNEERIIENCKLLSDEKSREIYRRAIKYRCTHDINDEPEYTKEKYFCDAIALTDDEIFIDGGSFVGDTVRSFVKKTKGRYKKIICFEPDIYNFRMLKKLKYRDMLFFNCGLYNEEKELKFINNMSVGSAIVEYDGKNIINISVNKIDNISECSDATVIKFDIEGAERFALEGAVNTIKRNQAKLIICIYHSDEDMLGLIEQVHQMVPEYRLHVRSHSHEAAETVLYAVP